MNPENVTTVSIDPNSMVITWKVINNIQMEISLLQKREPYWTWQREDGFDIMFNLFSFLAFERNWSDGNLMDQALSTTSIGVNLQMEIYSGRKAVSQILHSSWTTLGPSSPLRLKFGQLMSLVLDQNQFQRSATQEKTVRFLISRWVCEGLLH